jgi:hypothetical protein
MIAFLRNLVTRDLGLKVVALALALLIWSTVHFAGPQATRTFRDLPVRIVATSVDARELRAEPAVVDVTLRGDKATVDRFNPNFIRVTTDTTGLRPAQRLRQRVDVALPPGVTLVRATPSIVDIVGPALP